SAENRLDQSCDHRLVFDDQHPPGSLPDATLSSAQRSLSRGGPDVRGRLFLGTEEEGWQDKPSINPPTVCYCESSGILKLTRSPPSSNPIFAFPPRPWLTSRSIKVRPKPCLGDLPTGGPPRSTQSNTRLSPLRLSIAQETSSDPPAADREPYLTEFVPSSWTIMPSATASSGLSETAGPSMTMRSSRPVR